jgi:gas vesicle structural protein
LSQLPEPAAHQELILAELVSRVLDRGAVITGEVVISVAGVDLIYLGLQLVLTSVETARERGTTLPGPGAARAADPGDVPAP